MNKKAIVLGGTANHVELINSLKKDGYETILLDYYSESVAKPYADRHIQESTLDMEKVLAIAKEEKAGLVITTCIDQANVTACYVAEKLGLPHPYSYETALNATQKGRMKKLFKENDIPTSDYYVLDKSSIPEIKFQFPFVIKPTDANSSKGVYVIHDEDEFYNKLESSFSYSREEKVIVEKFVSGTEIQVDCIALDSKAHILMMKDMIPVLYASEIMHQGGYLSPGIICRKHIDQIHEIAQKIVEAFGFENTVFFYQAKCNENGVFVIELGARAAGGSAGWVVSLRSGINYFELAKQTFMQEKVNLDIKPNNKKFVGEFLFMKPGVFDHLEGVDDLIKEGVIDYVFPSLNRGSKVEISFLGGNRTAIIMAVCDTYEEGQKRIKTALSRIRTLDPEGNDLSYWR